MQTAWGRTSRSWLLFSRTSKLTLTTLQSTGRMWRLQREFERSWCDVINDWMCDLKDVVPRDAVGQMLSIEDIASQLNRHPAHALRHHAPLALARHGATDVFSPDDCLRTGESPPPQDSRPPQDRIDRQVNSAPVGVRGMSEVR
jgi:hypothetical protein